MAKKPPAVLRTALIALLAAAAVGAGILGAIWLVQMRPPTRPVAKANEDEIRRKERKNLESMLEMDLQQARQEGKSEAEIEKIKANYQSAIEALDQTGKKELPPN